MNSLKSRAMNWRAIVADDSGLLVRVLFQCSLYDRLDVTLGHLFADFPVDDEPAITVEQARKVVEGAAEVIYETSTCQCS